MKQKNLVLSVFSAISYLAMVTVNALANALPINNRNTGEISDAYPNLFAPAGATFSIWGLIYLLLGAYTIFQLKNTINGEKPLQKNLAEVNKLFIINALANIGWIFLWHYDYIGLTVVFMLLILATLIKITDVLKKQKISFEEKFVRFLPFSVYFGWISVATIANITTYLVDINWDGFGISDITWMIIILLVGAAIGIWRTLKDKSIPYGLVFIWAYLGIYIKHISLRYFMGQYPDIINTIILCLGLFSVTVVYLIYRYFKKIKFV